MQSFSSVVVAQSTATIPEGSYEHLVTLLLSPPSFKDPKDLLISTHDDSSILKWRGKLQKAKTKPSPVMSVRPVLTTLSFT